MYIYIYSMYVEQNVYFARLWSYITFLLCNIIASRFFYMKGTRATFHIKKSLHRVDA